MRDGDGPDRSSTSGLPVPPWHLPGVDEPGPEAEGRWHRPEQAEGRPRFRTPRLSREATEALARRLRSAALEARRSRSLDEVVDAVSRSARRLADPDTRWGRAAVELLGTTLGWPPAAAAGTLERMAEGWTADALRRIVEAELGDPGVLEGFRPAPAAEPGLRRRRRAAGPALVLQVQAGNVPGVGVTGVARALLTRSGVAVRTSRSEPGLAPLFARSLAERDPGLGRCVAASWWPRGEAAEWRPLLRASGLVVLYGGHRAVRALRSRLPPATDLVRYGPRLGVAVLLPDADREEAARDLARDVCAYEQRGCVSPRVVLSVGEAAEASARRIEAALGDRVRRTATAPLTAGEATALRELRAGVEFGADDRDGPRLVGDPEELRWTVLAGGPAELESEGLPRVVRVHAVDGTPEVRSLLAGAENLVQAVGVAGRRGREDVAAAAAESGVSRVSPLGRVAWPPADWRHDGRHQLLPLLRWTDWELPGEEAPDAG